MRPTSRSCFHYSYWLLRPGLLIALLGLVLVGAWIVVSLRPTNDFGLVPSRIEHSEHAIAMLNQSVDAVWDTGRHQPQLGQPLTPCQLHLKSGFAQIVLYSGARLVIEGPSEIHLISPKSISCSSGRMLVDVPKQAHGFMTETPHIQVSRSGHSYGLEIHGAQSVIHVFKGQVDIHSLVDSSNTSLSDGMGMTFGQSRTLHMHPDSHTDFESLSNLDSRSLAAEAVRYHHWRQSSDLLNNHSDLLVHLDFEAGESSQWQLDNRSLSHALIPDATIVGCQSTRGRWPEKRAVAFLGVNDRVCINVPGDYESLTLACWVQVQGLDRPFNSLFMTDGFEPGEIHWLIRADGVLSLAIKDSGVGNFQIIASRPVINLDLLGQWIHLAAVLDGPSGIAVLYLNGSEVEKQSLKIAPPYRIGAAELGNWNPEQFQGNDAWSYRNFSGAMDQFLLFKYPMKTHHIQKLFEDGMPRFR